MANYKLTNDYWETSGVYDITQGKTQREINAAVAANTGANDPAVSDKTATGGIASFDGTGVPLKNLTVNIEPVQSGSGDPSPENIRPITGWTGANVRHTGKNLANQLVVLNNSKASWDSTLEAIKFTNGVDRSEDNVVLCTINKPGQITLSYDLRHDGNDTGDREIVMIVYTDGTLGTSRSGSSQSGTWRHVKLTSDPNKVVRVIAYGVFYGTAGFPAYIKNVQVELGSVETEYEPYQGETYPITFPSEAGTVYGGTLDVTNGVLTVTNAKVAFPTSGWSDQQSLTNTRRYSFSIIGIKAVGSNNVADVICTQYPVLANDSDTVHVTHRNSNIHVFVSKADYPNLTSWTNYLSGIDTLPEVCYPLATPVTYTLTPIEVKALLGQNNIWADCGDVDVEYGAYLTVVENQLGERIPKVAVAPIEKTTTASKAYSVNEMFFMGDKLYIATASIASGATFTVGTNCDETTLGEQIAALLNA